MKNGGYGEHISVWAHPVIRFLIPAVKSIKYMSILSGQKTRGKGVAVVE